MNPPASAAVSPSAPAKAREVRLKVLPLLVGLFVLMVAVVVCRAFGLIRPFKVPTGAMSPAIKPGDHFFSENFSYVLGSPKRGDIIVFKTDNLPMPPPPTIYVKRLVGLPGDTLRLVNSNLFVNGTELSLSNAAGKIHYVQPPSSMARFLIADSQTVTVPAGHYFVLGDNSANSADSRYLGFVPVQNVLGRAALMFWPAGRIGAIQ